MRRRGRPRHPDILTPREWEVLALLREGLSNPDIAARLGIGREGVKSHVSEILGKLGVASRDEAALWEPSERPWWAGAAAPVSWLSRKAHVSWLAAGADDYRGLSFGAGWPWQTARVPKLVVEHGTDDECIGDTEDVLVIQ